MSSPNPRNKRYKESTSSLLSKPTWKDISKDVKIPICAIILVLKSELTGLQKAIRYLNPNKEVCTEGIESEDVEELADLETITWDDGEGEAYQIGNFTVYGFQYLCCYSNGIQGQRVIEGAVDAILSRSPCINLIALLGCSMGIHDTKIGDVVVPHNVDHYDYRVAIKETDIYFSGDQYNTEAFMSNITRQYQNSHPRRYLQWKRACVEHRKKIIPEEVLKYVTPEIHTGIIASGTNVVKQKEYKEKLLKERSRHLLALDTESAQFAYIMSRDYHNMHSIIIRGISDCGDDKDELKNVKSACGEPHQVVSVFNASLFLFFLLNDSKEFNSCQAKKLVETYTHAINEQKLADERLKTIKEQLISIFEEAKKNSAKDEIQHETYVIHDDNDGIFYQPDTKAILKDEVLQHMDETQRNTYQLGNAVYDSIKKELEKGERTYVYTIKKKKWTNPSSVKKDTGDEDDNELKNE